MATAVSNFQLKCNKKWWDSFLHISLGLNSLPESCVPLTNGELSQDLYSKNSAKFEGRCISHNSIQFFRARADFSTTKKTSRKEFSTMQYPTKYGIEYPLQSFFFEAISSGSRCHLCSILQFACWNYQFSFFSKVWIFIVIWQKLIDKCTALQWFELEFLSNHKPQTIDRNLFTKVHCLNCLHFIVLQNLNVLHKIICVNSRWKRWKIQYVTEIIVFILSFYTNCHWKIHKKMTDFLLGTDWFVVN